jgi:hypothetical protein
MTETTRSTAVVTIERADRFGKQLVSHLGRRTGGEWSADSRSGWIDLQDKRVTVTADDAGLRLSLESANEDLDRLEDIVGRHLVRFAADLKPVVSWVRSDGSAGTQQ